MLERLHERGFDDFDAAHLNVFQYPGPQGARPSELAARLRISKQALNYLLGELERLDYLERRPDPDDLRSKRVALTPRGTSAVARDPRGGRRGGGRLGAAARPGALRRAPRPPGRAQRVDLACGRASASAHASSPDATRGAAASCAARQQFDDRFSGSGGDCVAAGTCSPGCTREADGASIRDRLAASMTAPRAAG